MPLKGVKVASQGVFGTAWSGVTEKSTKMQLFFDENGLKLIVLYKNRPEFMVLKMFWNGDFRRWSVELPEAVGR